LVSHGHFDELEGLVTREVCIIFVTSSSDGWTGEEGLMGWYLERYKKSLRSVLGRCTGSQI